MGTVPRFLTHGLAKWPPAALLALALSACGGGGSDAGTNPVPPDPPPPPPPADAVTISGSVTYDFVPMALFGGLNYNAVEARPVRLATVQFVDGTTVVAATRTDINGEYSLDVEPDRSGFVRVRAESIETGGPSWTFRVVDNTSSNAVYTLDGTVQSSGTADSRRDLHAPSGWTGAGYGNERAAAPFAVLDAIYEGVEIVLTADANLDFPPLNLHWSPENRPAFDADGNPDPATGEIGTSFYAIIPSLGMNGIYLLGAENTDTEEYDRHVILHEFAHYLERQFARNDSIGGPHARGDILDMRVAFSEGWATAFAGIALGNPDYRDSGGSQQAGAGRLDLEGDPNPAPGWFSEQSVQELIYDLVDLGADFNDAFSYPFPDIWDAMTDAVAESSAVTSIFPLINRVKLDHPADQAMLDLLAADQSIGSIATDFGDNETNDAGSADVLPIYADLVVNSGVPVNVCSTDEFTSSSTGARNKLSSRRFVRFTPPASGIVTIRVEATEIPMTAPPTPVQQFADPDFFVHNQGPIAVSEGAPSAACEDTGNAAWVPADCSEVAVTPLAAVEHVLEVYEWTNTNDTDDPDYPPIGRTCFDITVTQP